MHDRNDVNTKKIQISEVYQSNINFFAKIWQYCFQNNEIYEGWAVQIFGSIGGFKLFLNEMGFSLSGTSVAINIFIGNFPTDFFLFFRLGKFLHNFTDVPSITDFLFVFGV